MFLYKRSECNSTLTLISALERDGWLTRRPGIHFRGRWVGPTASLDECQKSRPSPGFHPQTFQRVVNLYTDYANPAQTLVLYNLNINSLNAELNPICHLLALLGAHHNFHNSGFRVNPYSSFIFNFLQDGLV
jgi:hypothetical protein